METKVTYVTAIDAVWSRGTKSYSIIARLVPVKLDDVMVSNAVFDTALEVHVNDLVMVTREEGVIPKIVKVVKKRPPYPEIETRVAQAFLELREK